MTAGSAPATVRNTIPPAASGAARLPPIWHFPPRRSSPTARSRSADRPAYFREDTMSGTSSYQPQNAFLKWFERRLPILGLVNSSFVAYPPPRNLNYWGPFGGILSFMLGVQIVTGIVLVMHFTPHVDMAFNSVEYLMRDVNYGWL